MAISIRALAAVAGLGLLALAAATRWMPSPEAAATGPDFEPFAGNPEGGQSWEDFVAGAAHRPPELTRIDLLPLGWPPAEKYPLLELLSAHAAATFDLPVRVLEPLDLPPELTTRERPDLGFRQLLSRDVLAMLQARRAPDALALVAITPWDLYPNPRWNFVFGEASSTDRVSVVSFARYHPDGPAAATRLGAGNGPAAPAARQGSWLTGPVALSDDRSRWSKDQIAAFRALNVLASQISRTLGLGYCTRYRCNLNWPDSLAALDSRPLHACPECLRKLGVAAGLDPQRAYPRLAALYARLGLATEARWVEGRVRR